MPKARNLLILPVFCKFIEKIGNFGKLGHVPPKIANCYKKTLFENRNYLMQKTFEYSSALALGLTPSCRQDVFFLLESFAIFVIMGFPRVGVAVLIEI